MFKYALLVAVVCLMGGVLTVPFYILARHACVCLSIYILCCLVTFFILENWTLVGDLNMKLEPTNRLHATEQNHVMIIGELSEENFTLRKHNVHLQRFASTTIEAMHWTLLAHKAVALNAIKNIQVNPRIRRISHRSKSC